MNIKNLSKKQKLVYGIPLILVICSVLVMAGVFLASIDATAHVSEPLSTTTIALDFSGYAGETIVKNIDITNDASVSENVKLSWTETLNVDGVTYTTDMEKIVALSPGANSVSVSFTYASDSKIGDVSGEIVLERVA